MVRLLVVLVPLLVLFWIVSIVDCAMQPGYRARGVSKAAWLVIVIVLPAVGGVLWFAIGRGRRNRGVAANRAPDDDPQFLGSLGSVADQDERIRRLEEELAQLDSEADWEPPTAAETEPPTDAPDPDEDPRDPRRGAIG